MKPSIAIVILNWNGRNFLEKFLPSVVTHSTGNVEVIVADNGSDDDSERLIAEQFPSVTFLALEKNHGFAEGYNQALSRVTADYYLLLNSDVEVTPGWLGPMVDKMEADRSVVICQPKVLSLQARNAFEYAGAAGGYLDRFGYPFCRGRILQVVEDDHHQYDDSTRISWATGACLLIRSDQWHKAGGFDASFWAHMEEIDLCWRLQHSGYHIAYVPESVVYHLGGGTLNYNHPRKIYLNFRNNLFLLFKNLPLSSLIWLLPFRMCLDGLAALAFLAKGEFGSFSKVLMAHLDFYRQLPALIQKRKQLKAMNQGILKDLRRPVSILWQYFIRKKRIFSEIQSNP
ncbi:MAG: glycosyltransferase family 2 protein [Marinilabiliales bacterium]|nr:glycosyltransferase family 2 protein [Marinilabiliales bacterium]